MLVFTFERWNPGAQILYVECSNTQPPRCHSAAWYYLSWTAPPTPNYPWHRRNLVESHPWSTTLQDCRCFYRAVLLRLGPESSSNTESMMLRCYNWNHCDLGGIRNRDTSPRPLWGLSCFSCLFASTVLAYSASEKLEIEVTICLLNVSPMHPKPLHATVPWSTRWVRNPYFHYRYISIPELRFWRSTEAEDLELSGSMNHPHFWCRVGLFESSWWIVDAALAKS